MDCVLVNMFSFLVLCNLLSPAVAAVLPRQQQDDDVVDDNYSHGPSLTGAIILSVIAFILFLIMLTLVVFAIRKYRKRREGKHHPTFTSPFSWANSRALRVDFHSWRSLSSEASLPTASQATRTRAANPTSPTPEVVEMYPTSPFRTSFPVTIPPQARAL